LYGLLVFAGLGLLAFAGLGLLAFAVDAPFRCRFASHVMQGCDMGVAS